MSLPVLRILFIALVGAVPLHPLLAVQAATVAGTVTDDRSVPLAGARVAVEGSTLAATTDIRGRFRIENVPGSSITLRVSMVGYKPTTVQTQSGAQDVAVKLTQSVFELNDLVITGTAGGEERRAVGNTVANISAAEVQAIAPSADVSQLINGRAANVVFQANAGSVGSGGKIRIRGTGSLSLSNEPLLYIDGVRADNSTVAGTSFSSQNRLNDIDPSTIESVEIIKGPAAATLYGTEASNGVIQIITKKGSQGARGQVGFEIGQGANWMWNPEKLFEKTRSYYVSGGEIKTLNLVQQETDSGRPIFRSGRTQRYAMDARGGNQALQYFFSGGYDDQEGAIDPNRQVKWNGRANLQAAVTDKLSIAITSGYISSKTDIPNYELMRGVFAPFPAFIGTPARGFLTQPPEIARIALQTVEDVSRLTGGVQFNYAPKSWLSTRLNLGVDDVNEQVSALNPFLTGFATQFITGAAALGAITLTKRERTTTTVDWSATGSANLTSGIGSKTSVGAQFYRKFQRIGTLTGTGFPAPGVSTVSSAATRTATETRVENKTVGVFVQEQLSFKNRFFLTGAVRADDNSAFGSDFNLITYPKVSAAWVVSDEPFWSKGLISTLRLRGAYGKAGLQPDQFAALRSYQAITGPGGVPAVRPLFLGNPALGPERGGELDVGFELGLFDDKIGLDFTFFDKRTKDAILARQVAPSSGFGLGTQFVNVGEVRNRGVEVQLTTTPVNHKNFKMDLSFAVSHTQNKIVDMGGIGNIVAGINQEQREGFPIGSFFYKKVVSADPGPAGAPINIMCDAGVNGAPGGAIVPCATAPTIYGGQPLPKFEGAFNATVQLWQRLTLSSLVDFKTGGRNFNADIAIQCQILRTCEANVDPASDFLGAADMAVQSFGLFSTPEVRYIKIRSVAASYRLSEKWARVIGGQSAFVTLTARNLHTFTNFKLGPDPELGNVYTGSPHNQETFQSVPFPFQFFALVRVTY